MYLEYPNRLEDPLRVLTPQQWDTGDTCPGYSYEYIEIGVDPQFPTLEALYAYVDRENERRRRLSAWKV